MATTWWRTTWSDAVFASDLKPLEKLVALVYADHAGMERAAWVTLPRLMERSSLSRDAARRARRGLVQSGWLVEREPARQQRAAHFELVIPHQSSSTPDVPLSDARVPRDVPLSSTPDVPLDDARVLSDDARVLSDDARVLSRGTNQSSYPSTDQSSSSPRSPERLTAQLLGWDEEDERLRYLSDYLQEKNVAKAAAWLRACHTNGDLERTFGAYASERVAAEATTNQKQVDVDALWERVIDEAGSLEAAYKAATTEAEALGRWSHRDPFVLKSTLVTLGIERQKAS